jgi:hypothetical protein
MTTTRKLNAAARRPLVLFALALAAAVLAAVPLAGAALRHTTDASTIGQSQVGTLVDWGGPNWLDMSGPYQVSSTATIYKLTGYMASSSAPTALRGVIYSDNAGKPGAFVAVSSEVKTIANLGAGWLDLPFTSPVTLQPGSYWLGYWYADGNGRHNYLNVSGAERYAPATYSATGNPPSTFPAGGGTSSSSYSLYASYTTSPSAAPVNVTPPSISLTEPGPYNYLLTATAGTWANSPTSYTYAWYLGSANFCPGTTGTPSATGSTVPLRWSNWGPACVTLAVTATNTAGSTTFAVQTTVGPSEVTVIDAPTVSGTPRVGSTLSAGTGNWDTNDWRVFGITWLRCTNLSGNSCVSVKTSNPPVGYTDDDHTYVLTAADVGSTIRAIAWMRVGTQKIGAASAVTAFVTP